MIKKGDIYKCIAPYSIKGEYLKIIKVDKTKVCFVAQNRDKVDFFTYCGSKRGFDERFQKVSTLKKLLIDWDAKESEEILNLNP